MTETNKIEAEVSQVTATANPAPLGLAGFAVTTFVLSIVNAQLLPAACKPVILGLGFFYGGLAQLLAGMQEFKKNNVFGATAFSTYGAFWMSLVFISLLEVMGYVDFGPFAGSAIGYFLLAFTIFNTYMWIASFKVSAAVCMVFTTLELTFSLLVLAEFGFISSVYGGIMGIVTSAFAWYASAAEVINTVFGKTVFPVGPANK